MDDKPRSGRPRRTRTNAAVKAVAQRIRRNPLCKQKIMAREMKIPPYALRQIRATRAKKLLQQYAKNGHRQILFTDEKIFIVEEIFNRQNDRVYARNSREAAKKNQRIERGHHPALVMVWWGVSYEGITQLHFCEQGKRTGPFSRIQRLHIKQKQQRWLEVNLPGFIAAQDWPSGSPDLNPLEYILWSILEEKACSKPHRNIESLKADLVKSAASIPLEVVRAVIDKWPNLFKKYINANGGHFE
ncbi:Hypothetical protein CINCED_3A023201 [Cinara cedri]|uniref:Uncharacterized protein n=1 Tax=Cinara cedri TaxID=506608 RepID=A0A5E4MKN8_9HEMI|nr:Hypothetical protein CINCED_3A023201 [Cinara cedri]